MFDKKLVISIVVIFVVWMFFGGLIHGFILHGEYAKLPIMRSESAAHQLFGFMILAHVIYAAGFCWIYARGKEARPWLGQGFRYGLAVATITVIPTYMIYYVVMPYPSDIVAQQIVYDTIATVILGVVVAWLYRK
jgi:hypothetical protein